MRLCNQRNIPPYTVPDITEAASSCCSLLTVLVVSEAAEEVIEHHRELRERNISTAFPYMQATYSPIPRCPGKETNARTSMTAV